VPLAHPTTASHPQIATCSRRKTFVSTGSPRCLAIEALRSNWLRERGPDSFSTPGHVQVYLDDSRVGGVETLRMLSLANVLFIRHVNGVDAAARWGLDHGQGVILVSTRR